MKFILLFIVIFCFLGTVSFGAEPPALEGKGIVIVPKYFQPTSEENSGSLGFSYKIDKTLATPASQQELSKEAFHMLNLDFKAEGNVAFNSDANPADFLKTGIEVNYVYQYASVLTVGGPGSKCDPTDPTTVKECEDEARRSQTGDALTAFAGLIGSLEADQKFDKRNGTYGVHITTVYRPAPGSFVNQANPLDWPFRFTRALTGHPTGFFASPDAFPKVRLAAERIHPSSDTDRALILTDTPDYNRVNVEIAMTSPMAIIDGKQVKFECSWRYFKEIDAADAIKAAGLDQFHYFAASLVHDSGWLLTYASGKLPLDRQNDQVWELGYRFKF